MKLLLSTIGVFIFISFSNVYGQSQEIDAEITKLFDEVKSSCDFIETMNYYLSIELMEDIDKKEFDQFLKICRCVNKKNIPLYEIRSNTKNIDLYFKDGKKVYNFKIEKRDNLYFSTVMLYTFKNRKVKKQGRMAFKA